MMRVRSLISHTCRSAPLDLIFDRCDSSRGRRGRAKTRNRLQFSHVELVGSEIGSLFLSLVHLCLRRSRRPALYVLLRIVSRALRIFFRVSIGGNHAVSFLFLLFCCPGMRSNPPNITYAEGDRRSQKVWKF